MGAGSVAWDCDSQTNWFPCGRQPRDTVRLSGFTLTSRCQAGPLPSGKSLIKRLHCCQHLQRFTKACWDLLAAQVWPGCPGQ